jgi:periplasmic protein TonB
VIRLSSLPLAVGASVALHAAALGTLQALPGGLQLGGLPDGKAVAAVLHATLAAPVPPVQEAPRSGSVKRQHRKTNETKAAAAEPKAGVGPTYFPAHLLDERPQVRNHVEPRFPEVVDIAGGRVVAEIYINEKGTVDEVLITEAEPAGYFETATAQAFGAALFRPGHKAGVPVKSRLAIEVLFGAPVPMSQAAAINGGRHE